MAISFEFFGSGSGTNPDELRNRLRRLEALIARAPVPIAIAHDAECRMISANEALAELLGVSPDENISLTPPEGRAPKYRIQQNGKDMLQSDLPMQYAIAHRASVRNEIEVLRADGTVRYIQNDVEPLYDSDGTVIGCVSVCVDQTERRRAERLLRESDRRKDEFLASLSHELRNPLDVSRITRNTIDLRRDRIDIRVVLHSAIETTQPLIAVAGQILTVDMPRESVWVHADFTRLAQAVSNLMNNAVKYTPRGGRITLRA